MLCLWPMRDANIVATALLDSVKADHGYSIDSRSVRNLLQILSGFTLLERRDFLQFVTGSPKLPIGGKLTYCCNNLVSSAKLYYRI